MRRTCLPLLLVAVVSGDLHARIEARLDDAAPFTLVRYTGGNFRALAVDDLHIYIGVGSRIAALTRGGDDQLLELAGLSLPLPELVNGLVVAEPGTVVVSGSSSLYSLSTTGKQRPTLVGETRLVDPIVSVACDGALCYVLGEQDVQVIQLTHEGALERVGQLRLPLMRKQATELVVGNGLLYIAGGARTVLVVDVSRPREPAIMGGLEAEVLPTMLATSGRRLYFLDGSVRFDSFGNRITTGAWLSILEVRDVDGQVDIVHVGPLNVIPPARHGFHPLQLMAVDGHIYINGWSTAPGGLEQQGELHCLDLTDPDSPSPVSAVAHDAPGESAIAHGHRLFFGATSGIVRSGARLSAVVAVADVKEAGNPKWLDRWQLGEPGRVASVATLGRGFALHESGGNTHIYDGERPEDLRSIGFIDMESTGPGVSRMVATSERLYTLADALAVFDISDRAQPQKLAQGEGLTPGQVLPVLAVEEPYIYVADGSTVVPPSGEPGYRVVVYRYGALDEPPLSRVAELVIGAFVDSIEADGRWLYVVYRERLSGPGHLALVDCSDPTHPVVVRHVPMPEGVSAKRIIVRGEYAYILGTAVSEAGKITTTVQVFDAAGWESATVLRSFSSQRVGSTYEPAARGQHYAIGLMGDKVLVSGHELVIRVIDIGDGRSPVEVQAIPVSALVDEVVVSGAYVFVVLVNGETLILKRNVETDVGTRTALYLPLLSSRH